MDRRGFLTRLASVLTVATVAPKVLSQPIESEWFSVTDGLLTFADLERFLFNFTEQQCINGLREITKGWFEFGAHPTIQMAYLIKVPKDYIEIVKEWLEYVRPAGVYMDVQEMRSIEEEL